MFLYANHHSSLRCIALSPFALCRVKISPFKTCSLQISTCRQLLLFWIFPDVYNCEGLWLCSLLPASPGLLDVVSYFYFRCLFQGYVPLWSLFFLNKNNFYMILWRSSNPHNSGLGACFAVVTVCKALDKSGIVSFWDMMGEEDLL